MLKTTIGKVVVRTWVGMEVVRRLSVLFRAKREDERLEMEFGDAWVKWSEQVRYMIIPGIY